MGEPAIPARFVVVPETPNEPTAAQVAAQKKAAITMKTDGTFYETKQVYSPSATWSAVANIPFTKDDVNGDCFELAVEGEAEKDITTNHVWFFKNMPYSKEPAVRFDWGAADMVNFMVLNVHQMRFANSAMDINEAVILSAFRYYAAREGLISPALDSKTFCVKYNDSKVVKDDGKIIANLQDEINQPIMTALTSMKNNGNLELIRLQFPNYVCMVACMFRMRGHHYMASMAERYREIWEKVYADNKAPILPWEKIATIGLHAIFPMVLDNYWMAAIAKNVVRGALRVRFHTAPAGGAQIQTLRRGWSDITSVFAALEQINAAKDDIEYYKSLLPKITRWNTSINCGYYGVPKLEIDEGRLGTLASMVIGVYDAADMKTSLQTAPSLMRLARQAPILGVFIGAASNQVGKELALIALKASSHRSLRQENEPVRREAEDVTDQVP
jgi:hypothetical protein